MTTTELKFNSRNARRLIARLKSLDENAPKFNMMAGLYDINDPHWNDMELLARHEASNNWCGTQACIGGHAAILAFQDNPSCAEGFSAACSVGAVWLGMDPEDAVTEHPIFGPLFYKWKPAEATSPLAAVLKLEALIDEHGDGLHDRCTDEEWKRLTNKVVEEEGREEALANSQFGVGA